MSDGKDVGKYWVENQQLVQGQIVGDYATVHIHPPPLNSSPISPTPSIKQVWNVPYPRNALFTGHEDILTQLATLLQTGQPTALSGLGGIGKTHLALEYAYRHKNEYQAVLWALAESKETLTTSFLTLATLLNLPEKDAQESTKVIAAVQNWLRTSTRWLLILDNADDLIPSRDFLPPSFTGHVLLTTRAQAMGRFSYRLEVETLPLEQGTLFLLRRIGLLAPDAPIGQALEIDQRVASEIANELGGLPLALDQAGAYIEETGCSLTSYQYLYQQHRAILLAERRGLIDDHPLPVATTWKLSFEQVEQKSPAAADLLRVCAFLAPDAIPEMLITQGAPYLGPQLAEAGGDTYRLNQAIEVLRAYSLVRRDMRSGTEPMLSMHRLVQAVLKDQMNTENKRQWAERIVRAIYQSLLSIINRPLPPSSMLLKAKWEERQRYLPHMQACASLIEQWDMQFIEATRLLHATADYIQINILEGEETVEHLYKKALDRGERIPGAEDDVANCLNSLAVHFLTRGKYEEAEPFCQRALAIYERLQGPDSPDVVRMLELHAILLVLQSHLVR